ncbi:DeoR/GlpR family DNA-binding transcription regulator [Labrenzia sp. 011]|uniref:DeoR/GlpR family DNA-binding transcription regulator n=1 Tax=Labrenzia sp. 011 TaxID=2171494 RepID=UPI000D514C3C|nr:DeoR/GlpR family DNA-binding transcription regulator [Labrenzia sp. 011]PVB62326.1 DeoR/GlpR transcriptional regulator [Labrenzia sp. 011]
MTLRPSHSELSDRQKRILETTEKQGFVTIERLAEEFDVSTQTVRRDIIFLSEAGHLQRFHGGAGAIGRSETLRLDHGRKEHLGVADKELVARNAAECISDGASLFLDVGTTMEFTARELNKRNGLAVFTNSIRAALAFDPKRHNVTVLGGRMAGKDGSLVGEEIIMELNGLRIDHALIACSGIDAKGRVMDFDLSKIAVKKAAMAAADENLLLATPSKFNRTALSTIAMLSDFNQVIDGTNTHGQIGDHPVPSAARDQKSPF